MNLESQINKDAVFIYKETKFREKLITTKKGEVELKKRILDGEGGGQWVKTCVSKDGIL